MTFRLTAPVAPEDETHYAVWCALRRLLPPKAVITTWEARNAISAVEGARRKRLGLQPGWPDMGVLFEGRLVLLEIKADDGVLSPAQKQLHPRLEDNGFPVTICRGRRAPDEALAAVRAAGIPVHGKVAV